MRQLQIEPFSAPRLTKRSSFKGSDRAAAYQAWRDHIRLLWGQEPLPARLAMRFYVPLPKSLRPRQRLERAGSAHTQTPDVDNFAKAVMDALAPRDAHIWHISATKRWSHNHEGLIEIGEDMALSRTVRLEEALRELLEQYKHHQEIRRICERALL